MAVFNPQIQPTNDPSYLGYSRGIQEGYGVDKSKGIALETLGKGIEEGATIVDTGIKDYLKQNIRGTVEKQRDDYTQYLNTLKTIASTNQIPSAGTEDSIMDANANMDIPDGLQAGLDRAKSLAAATNTGNRINDTLYTANLASSASELRTKWGGYKDYIDQKFAEYSGFNPANAYYKNLMQDINTLAARGNADKNKVDNVLLEAVKSGDVDNADVIWSLHKAGKMSDDEAIHQVFKSRSIKAAATAAEAARTARKGDRDDTAAVATRDFSKEFSDKVNSGMELIQIGTGTQTLKSAVNWITQMSQNPDKVDNKQVQAVVTALNAKYDELYQGGLARAAERDSTGQTYITRMGGVGKVKEEMEGNLSGLKQYITSVNNQQWGLGTYIQRKMAGQSQQDQASLLEDPDFRKTKAFSDAFPTFADLFIQKGLAGNIPEKLSNYYNGRRIDVALQPDFLSSGKVTTLKSVVDGIDKQIGADPKYTEKDVAKLKTEVFNIPKTIADPKAPIDLKANIARGAFDPENIGILQGIKMDYYDPNTKKYIPGKYSAYTRMTSPDISENMWKIKGSVQDGPQLWDNYKNFTQTEFQKLFREDIVSLNDLNDRRLHVGWSSGENGQPPRLHILNERGEEPTGAPATPSVAIAMRTAQRINSAMYNLHQIYKKEGEDTNMPILKDMFQTWTPNEKVTGLPAKVMEAIIQANKNKLNKMEDTFFPESK